MNLDVATREGEEMWLFIAIAAVATLAIIGTHVMAKINSGQNWYLAYALILVNGFILGCGILQ